MQMGIVSASEKRIALSAWIPRRIFFLTSSILLVVLWVILSRILHPTDLLYSNVAVTTIIFILLGAIAVNAVTPRLSKGIKHFLILWIVLKIIFAIVYFDTLFVSRIGNAVTITEYGDSYWHHRVAVNYFEHWSDGKLFTNPTEVTSLVEQWGYDYFLGLLYYITGPLPETGIILNSFLALIFCLLGYRLFILAGLSQKDAQIGLIILSFSPVLWIVSSYLYKDSLLFVVVLACAVEILKILKEFKIPRILVVMILLGLLIPLRYSYIFVMFLMIVLGSIYLKTKSLGKKFFVFVSYCLLLLLFSVLIDRFALLRSGGIIDMVSYIQTSLQVDTSGGYFMTQGLGRNIGVDNFYYVLPAKAVYILMIPFPWFGGQSIVDQAEYLFGHLDAIYYFSLLAAVGLAFLYREKVPISKEQKLLLLVGLLFFLIPLFMFFPARRYVAVCVPFFMVYALPIWLKKNSFSKSILISFGIILTVQVLYYLR